MATLALTGKDPATVAADALVVGVASGPSGPVLLAAGLPADVTKWLTAALPAIGATGGADQLHRLPAPAGVKAKAVALAGVGPRERLGPEALRRAAGSAVRQLAGLKSVVLALPAEDAGDLAGVAEGALFGAYAFRRYRTGTDESKTPVASVTVATTQGRSAAAKATLTRAAALADAVHGTRDLINTAPVDLYPAAFADEAVAAVADLPVKVTVLDEKKLLKGGYGGIIGVGKGSARPPRLVRLDYAPAGATRHIALVGKGITFDTGGISIKPAGGMEAMKSDMSGAAAVLHTVRAAAVLGLDVHVTGWLAIAENMPSGTAQKPSDVLVVRGGTTVEVLNTDAEGRLVLADAIVAAGEENPDVIIDIATLTGAQMVALGNRTSAIMANHDGLRTHLHELADAAGEQFWPMPLPGELRSSMDSRVADIANIGDRFGGMLVAGLFLKEFLPERTGESGESEVPWAHLDIAGPAFNTGGAFGYTPVGGTGVGVRIMLRLLETAADLPL